MRVAYEDMVKEFARVLAKKGFTERDLQRRTRKARR